MAEKTKTYRLVKFPYELIEKAYNKFLSFIDAKTRKSLNYYWAVTTSDSTWQFNKKDEFIFEYIKPDVEEATLMILYTGIKFSINFHRSYSRDIYTRVSVSLPNRDDIENVFNIFELGYKEIIDNIQTPNSESEQSYPHYNIKRKIPSIFLDKESLLNLEKYILSWSKQLASEKENIADFRVSIIDSFGRQSFKSVSSYPRDIFDNEISKIVLNYGERSSSLQIDLTFSKTRDDSELTISYMGKNARENVESIKMGIIKILKETRNWNVIYYPSFAIKVILFYTLVTAIAVDIVLFFGYHTLSQLLPAISLFIAVYLLAPQLKPHITFKTRKNMSIRRWSRFIVEAILTILLGWFLLNLIPTLLSHNP